MEAEITKILDLDASDISKDLYKSLAKISTDYRDLTLGEHLYSEENINTVIHGVSKKTGEEIQAIKNLMRKHDCAYFRIKII